MKLFNWLTPAPLLVALACGTPTAGVTGEADSDVAAPAVELLPTPFTAEQIQASCLPGSTFVFRVDVPEQSSVNQVMRFVSDDGENALVESWMETPEGKLIGQRTRQSSPWSELRDHALLPAGSTRERASVTVEQGAHEGWLYSQPLRDERGTGWRKYWFSDRFPGPPVLMTESVNGREVFRMELIARAMP